MSDELMRKVIFFATGNVHKFDEARRVLAEFELSAGMLNVKSLEIQSNDLEEIAKASVVEAFKRCSLPVIVEDAGLFIDALKGFPGPYAAYVYGTIGNEGLLRLMESFEVRTARFESSVAYYSSKLKRPLCFRGEVSGEIARSGGKMGSEGGFGFDPIFRPAGSGKTFAQMSTSEKNSLSHRAAAIRKFAEWYTTL